MKLHKLFSLLFLFNFYSLSSYSQQNAIMVDILGFPSRFPNVTVGRISYERSFNKHFSAVATLEYGEYYLGEGYSSDFMISTKSLYEKYSLTGLGNMLQGRYYPFTKGRNAPAGFFCGLHTRYRPLKEKFYQEQQKGPVINEKGNFRMFDYGFHLGYKMLPKAFKLEILAGYGANTYSATLTDIPAYHRKGFTSVLANLRIEFSLGFVFPQIKKNN
ncbi:MAG: hypothetical protein J7604_20460 [Sporocytophaga sp.]|uniref:hypothetical protein n=1 Tax=Sporocytophaga sp. TaxID=2231183 RepID=UPI001B1D40ED|nr:hypothetical protein [Sporocytophaga sp.]MBO9702596.1 hypothetical protein [Sporocytophaga sp.]